MRKRHFLISLPLLVASCATVPSAPAVVTCPRVPQVEWDAPEPSFMPPMLNFLSGTLPALSPSDYSLKPAKLGTTKP